LRSVVADGTRVRVLAAGHSFSPIADTSGDLLSLDDLPRTVRIDPERACVTATAAIRYGELAARLDREGFALHNLASLPHISVAGACATGTHGSGNGNGGLATAVAALEMVTADGDLVSVSRDSGVGRDNGWFAGMVVALGALGVVTSMTLDIEPAFTVRQWVYEGLSRSRLNAHFDEIFASAYSVSVFTDWRPPYTGRVWLKQRDSWTPPPRWLDARLAEVPLHPVPGMDPAHTTQQLGVPGPWHERLPHFRPEYTPSSGDELQSEYLVPRELAVPALAALDPIADQIAAVLRIAEIRTVAADDLWLSPCSGRDSAGFHFTWRPDQRAVIPVLAAIEERLAPFGARPHWGKLFVNKPASLYPRLTDFTDLAVRYDPGGTFRNSFTEKCLWDGLSSCAVRLDRESRRSPGSMSGREWPACPSTRRRGPAASPRCRCRKTCTATSNSSCAPGSRSSCGPGRTSCSTSRSGPGGCAMNTGSCSGRSGSSPRRCTWRPIAPRCSHGSRPAPPRTATTLSSAPSWRLATSITSRSRRRRRDR
jgi:alditol oxidase